MDEDSRSVGVETLLGDPKNAIVKLSIPMIIAMSFQTAYNLVDAIWVAGLGADSLAAVGFAFPIFFALTGLANGIGIGGSSAIARYIGRKDRRRAEQAAEHALVFGVLVAVLISLPLFLFAEDIFLALGAAHTAPLAADYGRVLFGGSLLIFLMSIMSFLLRGEGDAKRSSYIMMAGSILNMVLDPIFIYGLDMGVAGAGWATLVSFGIATLVMLHWYLVRRDTYVRLHLLLFRLDREIFREVFRVGIPASVQMVSMALMQLAVNLIILMVSDTDGVAVYSTGWRVISMAIIPLHGISSAVVPVTAAAFGAHRHDKLSVAHLFSVRFALKVGLIVALFILIFAPQISLLFSWSEGSGHLAEPITELIRINAFMVPGVAFGMMSSSTFQGMGMGLRALAAALLRALVMVITFTYILGVVLGFGLQGIWFGLLLGNICGSIIVFSWVRLSIAHLSRERKYV
ncbi:MAG: MATE family efflux transporter [Candidatus Methanomethylophilaceae archaeon]